MQSSTLSTMLPMAAEEIGGKDYYSLASTIGAPLSIAAMPLWGYIAARSPHLKVPLFYGLNGGRRGDNGAASVRAFNGDGHRRHGVLGLCEPGHFRRWLCVDQGYVRRTKGRCLPGRLFNAYDDCDDCGPRGSGRPDDVRWMAIAEHLHSTLYGSCAGASNLWCEGNEGASCSFGLWWRCVRYFGDGGSHHWLGRPYSLLVHGHEPAAVLESGF